MVESLMPIDQLRNYRYRGARALVLLHEQALRGLLPVWQRAKAAKIKLPATRDPSYASLDSLLHHALGAARGYMRWLCEKLGLPNPGIDEEPEVSRVEREAERYMEHLLERWCLPLADVEEARFGAVHTSDWGVEISLEDLLEHAVMHPLRHRFQLEELLESQGKG
jgi:uncharacterized damage-inducible protein DinB